jgi:hypothetical protein
MESHITSIFHIIRHEHKEQGNFYSWRLRHQDEPIRQKGQKEAFQLRSYVYDKKISAIHISGYRRTRQISEHVARLLSIPPYDKEILRLVLAGRTNRVIGVEICTSEKRSSFILKISTQRLVCEHACWLEFGHYNKGSRQRLGKFLANIG